DGVDMKMSERKDISHEKNSENIHGDSNNHNENLEHHNHETHNDHNHENHDHHGGHHHGNFKELLLKSLPLAIPILILSPMMGITLPLQFTFPYSDVIVGILSTMLLIYGGRPFYQGAVDEFKQKSPGMMALVSLGISVSYLYSIYAVILRYL